MENPGTAQPKRFRIGFSFAGEKRPLIAHVASILADQFGEEKILYDKFHEAEFARNDLGIYLPDLYNQECDLVVVVVCKDYDEKQWTGLEWLAIHGLLQQRRRDEVMLCRYDRSHVDGLYEGAGFVELDNKTAEQLADLIRERLALNEGLSKNHYKVKAQSSASTLYTSIPNNLPRLQPFYGREVELKKIVEALNPASQLWGVAIDGEGGMGKTSLAVYAAYKAPPGVFKEIVFVTMKAGEMEDDGLHARTGFLTSGLTELLNELARKLGNANITKAPEEERLPLLRDALTGRQTLLILDNLESLTQREQDTIITFVRLLPPGCKAILTARGRIGSGKEELKLGKLGETAALDTLKELAENNEQLGEATEDERRELYTATEGKPLLLRWTAGQVGRDSCFTVDDAIKHLRSCPAGNDPLEFIFGDIIKDISEKGMHMLCALALFTLSAKAAHIAPVAETQEEETGNTLRAFANRSLAIYNREQQTFTLVPLVADFLRRKKENEITEAGKRLEEYVYDLVEENGWYKHERFPILDAAWPLIAASLPILLAGPNDRLQIVCSALSFFLNFTGRWDERLVLSRKAEQQAITAGDWSNAGNQAYYAGWVYRLRRQSAEVLACADRAAAHWLQAQAGDREQAIAIQLRGIGHQIAEDYPSAIAAYQEAVTIYRRISPESEDVARGLNNLADVEVLSDDYTAAERDCREALRIAKLVNYREGIAVYTGNLVSLALGHEKWEDAEVLAREALLLSEKLGRMELIAVDNYRLAKSLTRQGKRAEALPYAQRAVELYKRLGHHDLAVAQETLDECEG